MGETRKKHQRRKEVIRKAISLMAIVAMLLTIVTIGSASSVAACPSYTENWDGRGLDSENCGLVCTSPERTVEGWIHWVFSTKGDSTDAQLVLGGTGSGTYSPGEPLVAGVWHFYTPYFDLSGLTATIYLFGGAPGPGGGLVISDFCPGIDYGKLTVTKTAQTFYTRTYQWTIDKSVVPGEWNLFKGDSGTSQYTVAVTKTGYIDSAWRVEGSITIHNPTSWPARITAVSDVISGVGAATVNLGVSLPYVLPAGSTLTASYWANLPDGTNRVNTATVSTTKDCTYRVGGGSGIADVIFGAPTTKVNDTINVSDTNGGSWQFSDTGSVTYTETFICGVDCGTHTNTVTITETGQHDSATVTVNCYELQVSKTAQPSYKRTYDWTIDKSADQTKLTLATGEQFLVNYQVVVDATYTDSDWKVTGSISVHNPAPVPAVINNVSDLVSPSIVATVDCGCTFPYNLAAGGTLACTYSADLPDTSSRTNTATAVLQNYDYDYLLNAVVSGTTSFTGTADVVFGEPTLIDECIDVNDTYAGFLGTVCYPNVPRAFTYSRWIGPYDTCGDYMVPNTASFVTNDTGATGSDSWTVIVHVPCEGCTLTQGYWKTHSEFGPAPYDDTWALLANGASTPFFLSGKTWYQVFWTPPARGNAYYILAHQYMAARLNILNGASSTPEVDSAIAWAEDFFKAYTPSSKLSRSVRNAAIAKASLLEQYNEGYIGPGHCSE